MVSQDVTTGEGHNLVSTASIRECTASVSALGDVNTHETVLLKGDEGYPKIQWHLRQGKAGERFRSQETKEIGQANATSGPRLDPVLEGKRLERILLRQLAKWEQTVD